MAAAAGAAVLHTPCEDRPLVANTAVSAGKHRKAAIIVLALLSLIYAVGELVPGRFVVTDEVFYKAAGRNWAMTGRFAAPELAGRFTHGPSFAEVYLAQPPMYPFLFGVLTRLAGFSPRSCILYDALIHLLLVWSVALAARVVFRLEWALCALCGALVFPLGTIGRADELGIVLALGAAIAFHSKPSAPWARHIGGVLIGLCCATCIGAFVFLGPLIVWELLREERDLTKALLSLVPATVAGIATVAACFAPILAGHPLAYQQLFANAGAQSGVLSVATGNGWNVRGGFIELWTSGLRECFQYVVLALGLFVFAALCGAFDKNRAAVGYQRVVACAISMVGIVALMHGRFPYFWFPAAWLLIASAALAAQIFPRISSPRRSVLILFGACVWLISSVPYFHQKAVLWTVPADQSLDVNMERVRAVVPAGVGVMTTEYWWALADRDRVYDTLLSRPGAREVDYIVVSGNGSGKPATRRRVDPEYDNQEMHVVYSHLNPTPESIFGVRISRSSYGFGACILKREAGN